MVLVITNITCNINHSIKRLYEINFKKDINFHTDLLDSLSNT